MTEIHLQFMCAHYGLSDQLSTLRISGVSQFTHWFFARSHVHVPPHGCTSAYKGGFLTSSSMAFTNMLVPKPTVSLPKYTRTLFCNGLRARQNQAQNEHTLGHSRERWQPTISAFPITRQPPLCRALNFIAAKASCVRAKCVAVTMI